MKLRKSFYPDCFPSPSQQRTLFLSPLDVWFHLDINWRRPTIALWQRILKWLHIFSLEIYSFLMKPEPKVSFQKSRAGGWKSAGTYHAVVPFFLFRYLLLATVGRKLGLMGFWSDSAQPFLCSSISSENVLSTVWTDLSWASFIRRKRIWKYLIKLCSKNISNFSPLSASSGALCLFKMQST